MKKPVLNLLILLIFGSNLSAQLSEGGLPFSFTLPRAKSTISLPAYSLKKVNRQALLQEDLKRSVPLRYAIFENVNLDVRKKGEMDTLPDRSGMIWRLKIQSDSAYSLQVMFSKFRVPGGAKLFLYTEGYTQIAGAFTSFNMRQDSAFVTADMPGNSLIIEYYEPFHPDFYGTVVIGSVGKAYKDIFMPTASDPYVNINCPEGRDLQDIKHAVCKITFRSSDTSYLCTGALVNNAKNNEIPYFLTANHCISTSAEASSLVAYFNYENTGCSGTALTAKTLSGSTLLTASALSDYTLLKLNNKPPVSYQPYYAGWDAREERSDRVSGIHHPGGLTKKLAVDKDTISSTTATIQWEGGTSSPIGSHWQVIFDVGQTAGGSSGSPLFNKKKEIIGQLHGGDDISDLYGKFSYSWAHPGGIYQPLRFFLDPDNTGISDLEGYFPSGNPPDAFIDVPVSQVCVQAPIKIKDYSVFGPYTRNWTITPSTFSFVDGTDKTSENPVIEFQNAGLYNVKLNVSNTNGKDSMTLTNAFKAGSTITVNVASSPDEEACFCTFDHFLAWATGASNYTWSLLPGSANDFSLERNLNDTVLVKINPGISADSTFSVNLQVAGTQGICSDTAILSYDLILQPNDSLRNATLITYGKSSLFSNKCASVEPDEPVPPHNSCTTQNSWCDEYGTGENIVEHSVWFKFVAGQQKFLSVSSSGFDDEVAIYKADSYQDILNGNYTIIGANDDRSNTNFNPLINSVQVTAGNTYWIQVDGSGGGLTDDFYLQLTGLTTTAVPDEKSKSLIVYPQPARDVVYIRGDALGNTNVNIVVYSSFGSVISTQKLTVSDGILAIDVNSWEKGVYFVKVASGEDEFVTRIIKY